MCVLGSFCSPLSRFWCAPGCCSLWMCEVLFVFDTVVDFPGYHILPASSHYTLHHTRTHTVPSTTPVFEHRTLLSVSSWPLSCTPFPYAQQLDVIRRDHASDSASLPLRASSFSWTPCLDWWQIAITCPVTSDRSVSLPSFLFACHIWPAESPPLPVTCPCLLTPCLS